VFPIPDFEFSSAGQTAALPRCVHALSQGGTRHATRRISPREFCALKANRPSDLVIVDARFGCEFAGGHISGSTNVTTIAAMKQLYDQFRDANVCLVIYCEFSQNRGPRLMDEFREHDRRENIGRYPALNYPDICLLEGGYSRFYPECPEHCTGGYVSMSNPECVRNGDLRRSQSQYVEEGLGRCAARMPLAASVLVPWGMHSEMPPSGVGARLTRKQSRDRVRTAAFEKPRH
jgi:hypothetical protein